MVALGLLTPSSLFLLVGSKTLAHPFAIYKKSDMSPDVFRRLLDKGLNLKESTHLRQNISGMGRDSVDNLIKTYIFQDLNDGHDDEASNQSEESSEDDDSDDDSLGPYGKGSSQNQKAKGKEKSDQMEEDIEEDDDGSNKLDGFTPVRHRRGSGPNDACNRIRVGRTKQDHQIRVKVQHLVLIPQCDSSAKYIKSACSDLLAKAIESVARTEKSELGSDLDLVWAPWNDKVITEPLPYSGKNSLTSPASQFSWEDARCMMNRGFFGFRTRQDGQEGRKRKVDVRLLYNGTEGDHSRLRRALQDALRSIDESAQVWMATLQSCPKAVKVGRLMYAAPKLNQTAITKRVLAVIKEEAKVALEIAIKEEVAIKLEEDERINFCNYDKEDDDQRNNHTLRKVVTYYGDQKYANLFCIHMLCAYSGDPPKKYLSKGIEQRFVPAPGMVIGWTPCYTFKQYITETAKVVAKSHTSFPLEGFQPETFFQPLSNKLSSPFFISPFSIVARMPRSKEDTDPAFYQLWFVTETRTIHGLCVPGYTKATPTFAKMATHYFVATLKQMGGVSYMGRSLTPDGVVLSASYSYDLATHEIKTVGFKLPTEDKECGALKDWSNAPNPFRVTVNLPDPSNFNEFGGSRASRKVNAGFTARSALNGGTSKGTILTGNQSEAEANYTVEKVALKAALRRLKRLKLPVDDLLSLIEDRETRTMVEGLVKGKKKVALTRAKVPELEELLTEFCDMNDPDAVPDNVDTDDRSTNSNLTEVSAIVSDRETSDGEEEEEDPPENMDEEEGQRK